MNAKEFIKYAAIFAAGAYTQHKYTQHQIFRDPGFLKLFDAALQNSTDEDIDQLMRLEPDQLRDWVMAPEKIRPKLLQKFAERQQQIAYKNDQIIADKMLIEADDQRKKKIKNKLYVFAGLIGFIFFSIAIYNQPPECTKLERDISLLDVFRSEDNEMREKRLKYEAAEKKIIESGGWVCGKYPPQPFLQTFGIFGFLLSVLAALVGTLILETYWIPKNVMDAKKRQSNRLISSIFGSK